MLPYNRTAGLFALLLSATAAGIAAPPNGTLGSPPQPIDDPLPNIPVGALAVELQLVAGGMVAPLGLVDPGDGSDRLFIYDQAGFIRVVEGGQLLATPMLDVSGSISLGSEKGLLGLALHPQFATNAKIYTYTSDPASGTADFTSTSPSRDHQSVVAEWTLTGGSPASNTVNVASRRNILRIDQPQGNHNGGTLRFSPEGFLCIALGDGGGGNDSGQGHVPGGNGQSKDNVFGKLLRIDVDKANGVVAPNGQYSVPAANPFVGAAGLDEIFIYGLRNPFAFSFDSAFFTPGAGRLYIGDVGQRKVEEIDVLTNAQAGANLGWPVKEGTFFFNQSNGEIYQSPLGTVPSGLVDPVAQYDHDENGAAIIGGFVYRGPSISELTASYVFADYTANRLYRMDGGNNIERLVIGAPDRQLGMLVKGFGQDAEGEIYVTGSDSFNPDGSAGRVYRIIPIIANAAKSWTPYR